MLRKITQRVVVVLALAALPLFAMVSPAFAQEEARAIGGRFDTTKNAKARHEIDGVRAEGFPRLGKNYEVLRNGTSSYNCIAWSLGITDEWIWPGTSLSAFDKLNSKHGFHKLPNLDYKVAPGVEKIVLYGKMKDGKTVVTHQARQMSDGTWTSKMGKMAVIRHATPDSLDGPDYGHPVAVYARRR
jgi:type VI secretion system secreted protein VgrG